MEIKKGLLEVIAKEVTSRLHLELVFKGIVSDSINVQLRKKKIDVMR